MGNMSRIVDQNSAAHLVEEEACWTFFNLNSCIGNRLTIPDGVTQNRFIEMFLDPFYKTGYMPEYISTLKPLIFRITRKSEVVVGNNESYFKGELFDFKGDLLNFEETHSNSAEWSIIVNGTLTPCLRSYVNVGDLVYICGGDEHSRTNMIELNRDSRGKDLCVLNHSSIEKNSIPIQELYSSPYVTTTIQPLFNFANGTREKEHTVIITHSINTRPSWSRPPANNSNQRRVVSEYFPREQQQSPSINRKRVQIMDSPSTSSKVPTKQSRIDSEVNMSNSSQPQATGSLNTQTRARADISQNTQEDRFSSGDSDVCFDHLTYDQCLHLATPIPIGQRPMKKKFKGNCYTYETLQDLDNELLEQTRMEAKRGSRLSMMLHDERFTYGVVKKVLSPRAHPRNSYYVKIFDETKDDVLLRICQADLFPRIGPLMEVGQVIRVHHLSVQVEHDNESDTWNMVLSTTPHHNYCLFYLDSSKKLQTNTSANILRVTDAHKKRVLELLKYAENTNNPSQSQDEVDEEIPDQSSTNIQRTAAENINESSRNLQLNEKIPESVNLSQDNQNVVSHSSPIRSLGQSTPKKRILTPNRDPNRRHYSPTPFRPPPDGPV